ncbi:Glutamate-ammonia-ligase adenylyltransferase [uncultured Candidatus Thioglobus sp.]|nr:Glutamate-ammonia-ligase adenylyltransferase [uncultured Candidatus Thioglobus sp.]
MLVDIWDQNMSRSSMERWLQVCEADNSQQYPININLLAKLFGASWYFTRFVFFRGAKILPIFDQTPKLYFTITALHEQFLKKLKDAKHVTLFDTLIIIKNEYMLQIFLAQLIGTHSQQEIEKALTILAEVSLLCAVEILIEDNIQLKENIAILAMGRMAGYEMNFGSDIDIIFLYASDKQVSDMNKISAFTRRIISTISMPKPEGSLYQVDTRLRPYGNSGTLLTSSQAFVDYHKGERDIWERQMMKRCRVVYDHGGIANHVLRQIKPFIYQQFGKKTLCQEITSVRQLVIDTQIDTKKAQYNLKVGEGGIMDIDFLIDYLQLQHGHEQPELHTESTRSALQASAKHQYFSQQSAKELLQVYDYLKRIEGNLRVFDMKTIDTLSQDTDVTTRVARSMGYLQADRKQAGQEFLVDYQKQVHNVRQIYHATLNGI